MAQEKEQKSVFRQLKELAAYLDSEINKNQSKFEEKNREFCAPEVQKSMLDVKKQVKESQGNVEVEITKSLNSRKLLDDILKHGRSFVKRQNEEISKAESYLGQYGFVCKETEEIQPEQDKIDDDDDDDDEGQEKTVTLSSVQATPASSVKPSSRLNRTPQLEDAGLSQMMMDKIRAMDKKQFIVRDLKNQPEIEPSIMSQKSSSISHMMRSNNTGLTDSMPTDASKTLNLVDMSRDELPSFSSERSDRTFCIKPAFPSQPYSSDVVKEQENRSPQLEDAGLSKLMMDRLAALEKHTKQVPRPKKIQPTAPLEVPAYFQHDGIICSPSLFDGRIVDRSVLDLHEALATPVEYNKSKCHPGLQTEFESLRRLPAKRNADLLSSPTLLTHPANSKENTTPVEPELFTQGSRLNTDTGKKFDKSPVRKMAFDDMPPSPKLLGTYSFMINKEKEKKLDKSSVRKIAFDLTHPTDSKENITPVEPELFTQSSRRNTETGKKLDPSPVRKIAFDDMPSTPKLLGTYNFTFK